ncbi:MAG: hypothetical protein U1F76_20045 [Candidatus Competibacteraceae bacterium]
MANPKWRRERLLSLLPQIFVGQPDNSAIGTLINAMAAVLADLDSALERMLRDHWVTLASGDPPTSTEESALELLGHLLDVHRLRWLESGTTPRLEKAEETEVFRQRLLLTADIVTRGLTTPAALLALAVTALGGEICPRLQSRQDTTLGWGMPLGTRQRCPVCQGIQQGDCPNANGRIVDAWITDNPPQQIKIEKPLDCDPAKPDSSTFPIINSSLVTDIPAIKLEALKQPVRYLAVENRTTHEICLFAGELKRGEELSIWPRITVEETTCFDSYETVGQHFWRDQYPQGSAVIIDKQGQLRDVSSSVYYLCDSVFDEVTSLFASQDASEGTRFISLLRGAAFDDPAAKFASVDDPATKPESVRFAVLNPQVRTPRLRPGENCWRLQIFTKNDIRAIAGQDAGTLLEQAPEQATAGEVSLTLQWWQRPPATFRLRIPRNPWVRSAEIRGASALVKNSIEWARAAGVQALVDFPEPVYKEIHVLEERPCRLATTLVEKENAAQLSDLHMQVRGSYKEEHDTLGDCFSMLGIFDTTRLDWTHLG